MKNSLLVASAGLLAMAFGAHAQVVKPAPEADRLEHFASSGPVQAIPNVRDEWGFEPGEGFAPGFIGGQVGWTAFAASTTQGSITTTNPITGVQSLVIDNDPAAGAGSLTGAFSPDRGPQNVMDRSQLSVDIRITATGGADYDIVPQAPSQMFLTARVKFFFQGDIQILDDTGGGLAFVDTGVDWPVDTVFNLLIDLDPVANTIDYYIDGALIYSSVAGVFAGTQMEQVVLLSDNFHFGEVGLFDNLIVDTDFQDMADVSIAKAAAAPTPLLVGSTITYTLTASNAGPGDAADVEVTDSLPANLTYVSNTCGATVVGQDLTWTIGTLANGANATCDVVTTVNNFGPIDNTANIATSTMDPTPGNNSATNSLGGVPFPADVGVTLTSDAPMGSLGVGTQFTYTATGNNTGPGTAADLAFTLTLSGKVSFVSSSCGAVAAGNTVTWTVASLGVGASTSCAITVAVVAPGDLLSSLSVTTSTDDPNLVNNVAELVVGFIATQVPTLNQLGLLLLALILAGAAVVVIRR